MKVCTADADRAKRQPKLPSGSPSPAAAISLCAPAGRQTAPVLRIFSWAASIQEFGSLVSPRGGLGAAGSGAGQELHEAAASPPGAVPEEDAALLPSAAAAAPAQPPPSVLAEIGPALRLGMPMIVSQYLDRSAQQISVMMIGHIGPEELGAVVLATM